MLLHLIEFPFELIGIVFVLAFSHAWACASGQERADRKRKAQEEKKAGEAASGSARDTEAD